MVRSYADPRIAGASPVTTRTVGLCRSLRPAQWTKNLLVFAGLIFGQQLNNRASVLAAVMAFVIFCALSSGVYLINDILDRDVDRRHPQKSARPIASGSLSVPAAAVAAVVLLVGALAAALAVGSTFAFVALVYVVVMTMYSLVLKHQLILDALAVASGFVLRALAGAVAVGVSFSHWLLILTLLLALFLALGKRRAELIVLGDHAPDHPRALAYYSPALLDQLLGIVTASTLLAYAFYTISAETIARFGNDWLLLTFPFPLYGLFRYLHLVHQGGGGNPTEHLFSDRPLLLCVGLWAIAVILIIYRPWG